MHSLFCCGPCRIIVSLLDWTRRLYLSGYLFDAAYRRLSHVTGINHHHQSTRSPPNTRLHQQFVPFTLEAAAQFIVGLSCYLFSSLLVG
jgi:hypothetical protein